MRAMSVPSETTAATLPRGSETRTWPSVADATTFTVVDSRGRKVGRVHAPMFGTQPDTPDAFAVRSGVLGHRHFVVPNAAVAAVDELGQVVALRVPRGALLRFL